MRRSRKPGAADAAPVEVTIARLGAQGDGVAATDAGTPFHVALAAPGDRLLVRPVAGGRGAASRAVIIERLEDGPDRQAPPCPHFGACGGCSVQHVADAPYAEWKRGLVIEALARRGLTTATVEALVRCAPGTRRRVRFQAWRGPRGVALGFFGARSRRVVDIESCAVLAPPLQELLAPVRALLGGLAPLRAPADAAATLCDNGIDLTLGLASDPDLAARERLVDFAATHDLARLSWRTAQAGPGAEPAEPVVARRAPLVDFGEVGVHPPPDAFVQPTQAGEAALRGQVESALAGAARVADLYAGCGAFGLGLAARGAAVAALDIAAGPIAALRAAARAGGFGERVTAEARDIVRRPLSAEELARFDGVVLDPPRAGADAQARALAGSTVSAVAYVSCNPASFARDARTLADGGLRLVRVTPVDQFPWTAHLELVGEFRR